jgi:hypothetical protein
MRATLYGLLTVGLFVSFAGSADASFSGHFGGFEPMPWGHHGHGLRAMHGGSFRHLRPDYGLLGSEVLDAPIVPTNDSTDAVDAPVILAPDYVPPARKPVSSGPRIIVIGAQPTGKLPIVIYGIRPRDQAE